jgi:hypothetical protein
MVGSQVLNGDRGRISDSGILPGWMQEDGLVNIPAVVVAYDPRWPRQFERLCSQVDAALAGVEHVTVHLLRELGQGVWPRVQRQLAEQGRQHGPSGAGSKPVGLHARLTPSRYPGLKGDVKKCSRDVSGANSRWPGSYLAADTLSCGRGRAVLPHRDPGPDRDEASAMTDHASPPSPDDAALTRRVERIRGYERAGEITSAEAAEMIRQVHALYGSAAWQDHLARQRGHALADLREHWGEAYQIDWQTGQFTAPDGTPGQSSGQPRLMACDPRSCRTTVLSPYPGTVVHRELHQSRRAGPCQAAESVMGDRRQSGRHLHRAPPVVRQPADTHRADHR